jgi:Fe-S cluster assembly protein SufB
MKEYELEFDYSKYAFRDEIEYKYIGKPGLSRELIEEISHIKGEPDWMREIRLKAYEHFIRRPMPSWGPDLSEVEEMFDKIVYYASPTDPGRKAKSWDEVPEAIRRTFERLGIPEAERNYLAGITAQYDSEVVYHKIREDLAKKGVIFTDMDTAVREYPDLVREYFGTVVPYSDNKFAALNTAVWSGGSFVYVPKGVEVDIPLQTYFRINLENFGQFERTLIIAEEGSKVHYIEGCTAPIYSTGSLHSAVVEIIAKPGAHVRYTTIQNWAKHIYNLVTKRAIAYRDAFVEWVNGELGSKVTMKYPGVILKEPGARTDILTVSYAGKGQIQDSGAKAIHLAPYTTSTITSKSVSKDGGRTSYRGILKVVKGAKGVKSNVRCDALILDPISRSDTYPYIEIEESDVHIGHEATVGRVGEDQIFYLMSRGLTEAEAYSLIILGFIEPFTKTLPMEYAVELNRLIELEMEGSVG